MNESDVDKMFDEGFDCSQIVLYAVSEKIGLSKSDALKAAACFGIGMAQGSVCGAATGALIALGYRYGNDLPGDIAGKSALFEKRDEFIKRFNNMNGKIMCPELLGQRIDTLQELIITRGSGLYRNCPRYCVNAINILNDML